MLLPLSRLFLWKYRSNVSVPRCLGEKGREEGLLLVEMSFFTHFEGI